MGGNTASGNVTLDGAKTVTASSTDMESVAGGSEQYYITINKDSNVNTCTASQWVDKGASITVSATAKSGYKITGGTGTYSNITDKKAINVTSAVDGITIEWTSALS